MKEKISDVLRIKQIRDLQRRLRVLELNPQTAVQTVEGGVQLGETALTAYRGDRGKIAYDHTLTSHLSLAQVKGDSQIASAIASQHGVNDQNSSHPSNAIADLEVLTSAVDDDYFYLFDSNDNNIVKVIKKSNLGLGSGITYTTVADVTALAAIASPQLGDWAMVTSPALLAWYNGTEWRLITYNPPIIGTGNLYGESLHYAADAIVGMSDGGRLLTWNDLSGNGYTASSVSTGPTYKTNVVNGKPVIRFAGSTAENMRITNKIFGASGTPNLTVVAVVKSLGTTYGGIISTRPDLGSYGWTFRYEGTTTSVRFFNLPGTGGSNNIQTIVNQFNVLCFVKNGTNVYIRANDTVFSTINAGALADGADTYTRLGYESNGHSNMDLAELFVFESDIGTSALTTVVNAMKTKYNIA